MLESLKIYIYKINTWIFWEFLQNFTTNFNKLFFIETFKNLNILIIKYLKIQYTFIKTAYTSNTFLMKLSLNRFLHQKVNWVKQFFTFREH